MWNASPSDHPVHALRAAEVYATAIDRLGDPRPAQRIGALHTLAALAQESPAHRQPVVDVFCAVLRAGAGADPPAQAAVQRSLTEHLQPARAGSFWPGISVDLTGAGLVDLDLSGCHIGGALTLDGAALLGQVRLRGVILDGALSLHGTHFPEHAWFERAALNGPVRADGAVFRGDAWFGETTFAGAVSLRGAEFHGHAWFGGATALGRVDFSDAVFRRSAGFRGAVLHQGVELAGTTFLGPARVSRRGDGWNVTAPGWRVVVDPDNSSVGQLQWAGNGALIETTPV